MEQLPQLPVEESKQKLTNFFADINQSPRKLVGVMVIFSIFISLCFFGFLFISQSLQISKNKKAITEVRSSQTNESEVDSQVQDQRRKQDLKDLARALRGYKVAYGDYPSSLENLVPEFLFRVPKDPTTEREYYYRVNVDRNSFELRARLSSGDEVSEVGN